MVAKTDSANGREPEAEEIDICTCLTSRDREGAQTARGPGRRRGPRGGGRAGGYTIDRVSHIIPSITIDAVLDRYEVILFDAYGVLVHGAGPLPGAADLIARLNQAGRRYFIVTNDASKRPSSAAQRFQGFGLAIDEAHILTSGLLLTPHFAAQALIGARCAVLGPADSARYVEDAGGVVVPPDEPFDVLVVGDESGFPFIDWADAALSSLLASNRRRP